MSGTGGPEVRTKIVYRYRSSAGLMSGVFGSVFAILGIFTLGLVFLPFAVLFSLVSLLRSASGLSAAGFCAAIASSILTIIGFVLSPTTWLVLLGLIGMAVQNVGNQPATNPPAPPNYSALMQSPAAGPALSPTPTPTPQVPPAAIAAPAPESAAPPDNSSADITLPDSALPGMTPPPEESALQPATPQLSHLQGFAAGAADRAVMEAWFDGLSGRFKDGAEWWAANRSLRPQPTCEGQEASQPPEFYQGCLAAKSQLDQVDVRRLSDPEYRAGWNTPPPN